RIVGEAQDVTDLVRDQAAPPQIVELGQDTVADRDLGRLEAMQCVIGLLSQPERALRQWAVVEDYAARVHDRALVHDHDVQAGGTVPRADGGLDGPGGVEVVLDCDGGSVPASQRAGRSRQAHGCGKCQGDSDESSEDELGRVHVWWCSLRWAPLSGRVCGWCAWLVRSR